MNPRPKLRTDLVLVEQTYRGEQSFIVKDPQSRKYYRFRPVEIRVMQALDGEHTTPEAAGALAEEGIRVSAAAVEAFAGKLKAMGLCERTLGERSTLLMERLRAERRRRLNRGIFKGELMRMRWSVGDPNKLFDRWLPRLRFFFSRTFLVISVLLFTLYFLILGLKWSEFSQGVADLYTLNFTVGTLVVFWVTGTVIIAIHELGHGFTCKYFGGQVHEIGAMLMYFEPAFFCNVNDAWTFPELRARLWVTAAGSWIQLVIASVAAIVWWAVPPGTLISEAALAAVIIGGVTTVFMNINPLIPLDGYYALSDYLEVPNLRQRAFAYLTWLIKTRVLRLEVPRPPADEREQRIFLIYSALAAGYISLILGFFAVHAYGWLSRVLGVLGGLIFAAGLVMMLRPQLRSWGQAVAMAIRTHRTTWSGGRLRSRLLAGGTALLILGWLLPWPITISGPFTVAPRATTSLTAPDSGIVARVNVREGTRVPAGARLLQIRNFGLEREAASSRRRTDSLAVRLAEARAAQRTSELAQLEAMRSVEEAKLAGLDERIRALGIRALSSGVVITARPEDLTGRWVSRGESILQLGQPDSVEVRIALAGAGATAVRVGQPVRLLPEASIGPPANARLQQVSVTAGPSQSLEARLQFPGGGSWRPGMTGQARLTLRRSNVWGALWWGIRRQIRSDILL
ncbi:MAG TPA: HlyD family efflux transporter periplasmic adaptor subunit [Gemmatimonadales bacterium]